MTLRHSDVLLGSPVVPSQAWQTANVIQLVGLGKVQRVRRLSAGDGEVERRRSEMGPRLSDSSLLWAWLQPKLT